MPHTLIETDVFVFSPIALDSSSISFKSAQASCKSIAVIAMTTPMPTAGMASAGIAAMLALMFRSVRLATRWLMTLVLALIFLRAVVLAASFFAGLLLFQ